MHNQTYLKFIKHAVLQRKKISTQNVESIFEIDFEKFRKSGGELVIFDMDDTLTDFLGNLSKRTQNLLKRLQKSGLKTGIFSNCSYKRSLELKKVFDPMNIHSVMRSDKPKADGYLELCEQYNVEPENAMMVGDKLGTDLYGAYRAGIKTRVLVEPYSKIFKGKKAKIYHRAIRNFEKLLAN